MTWGLNKQQSNNTMTSAKFADKLLTGSEVKARTERLFFLDASGGRILSVKPDGSEKEVITTGCRLPDGIAVDTEAGHIYWSNMGNPTKNDGSFERIDFDGRNRTAIIPESGT